MPQKPPHTLSTNVKDDSTGAPGIPQGILQYLVKLEDGSLQRLYRDQFTSLTIFRSLSSIAKQYVMRMLCVSTPIESEIVAKWTRESALARHTDAIQRLKELRLIELVDTEQGECVTLNDAFRQCLQKSLTGAIGQNFQSVDHLDKRRPSDQDLDQNARQKLEQMFYYIVGHRQNAPPEAMLKIMRRNGLLSGTYDTATSKGYQFLFQPTHRQIWTMLLEYMDDQDLEAREMNRDEVLTFLFRLSFLDFGKAYPKDLLTPTQRALVKDLTMFGLVYHRKSKSHFFYPTRLSTYLSSGAFQTREERKRSGFLVVETAFKVYAYTTSMLRLSLLKLFVRLDMHLPNLVAGVITKQSVTEAFKKGIKAEQICSYLEQFAHERLREKTPVIPINVTDQIRLWEDQRNRLQTDEAAYLSDFSSKEEFDWTLAFVNHASKTDDKCKVFLHDDKTFQFIIVTMAAKDRLRDHRKKQQQLREQQRGGGGGFVR